MTPAVLIDKREEEMNANIRVNDTVPNGGFLNGFIESSFEMPPDGLNGDCIVHYSGNRSNCEMTVPLVNGMREGKAIIVNDGVPYLRLEYKQGSLTGVMERMSESGSVELRGHLMNGIESGFFEEYDSRNQVVWRGYYRNGVRDPEKKSRIVGKGSNNVRSVEKGEFYELDENGVVTQLCLYVNGMRRRVIQKFNGDVMIELDENERRVYEGGFKGDMENGFVRDGSGKEFDLNGIIVYEGEWKNGSRNGNEEEMNESEKVVRSGWWVNGVYQGVKSVVPREVKTVVIPSSLTSNPQTIEVLKIENNSYNDSSVTELKLSGLVQLKRMVIGDECFGSVRSFELDGLSELESVVIGQGCFTISKDYELVKESIRADGTCRIVNCPQLKSIQIDDSSFSDYYSFELSNHPSLQSIETGGHCFFCASIFSLAGSYRMSHLIPRSSSTSISLSWECCIH